MYARVVTLEVQRGQMDTLNAIFQGEVVPAVKEVAGFKSLTLLEDRKSSRAMMFSIWETEAAMKASETSGFLLAQLQKFSAIIVGSPAREAYEVGAQS